MFYHSKNSKREGHFQDYLDLSKSFELRDVVFNCITGGLSAIHRSHCYDKAMGRFGYKRGEYEIRTVNVLRNYGYKIILIAEDSEIVNEKQYDALLNNQATEIKAIEDIGRCSIRTKIQRAAKQGASVLILYFPESSLYTRTRILDGWQRFLTDGKTRYLHNVVTLIICIVEERIEEIIKPPG